MGSKVRWLSSFFPTLLEKRNTIQADPFLFLWTASVSDMVYHLYERVHPSTMQTEAITRHWIKMELHTHPGSRHGQTKRETPYIVSL